GTARHSISEKATHWVAFLRLGETNLLLMLALKPLNVPTTQLPNYPTTQLPNYPTTQLPNYPTTQLPNNPTTPL
ncbi:hypothetical protein, partial [Providencia rettgeri]|uniref:hypothetical protein n=1 Tax=Providencia rettgeri TaxID=587 RepID=UPI00257395F0